MDNPCNLFAGRSQGAIWELSGVVGGGRGGWEGGKGRRWEVGWEGHRNGQVRFDLRSDSMQVFAVGWLGMFLFMLSLQFRCHVHWECITQATPHRGAGRCGKAARTMPGDARHRTAASAAATRKRPDMWGCILIPCKCWRAANCQLWGF